jgi:hypothetical protein
MEKMDRLKLTSSLSSVLNKYDSIIILFLSLLPVLVAYIFIPDFMGDDTFIHATFIKGIIETGKFTFAGTETYGTTSPLWVLMNAAFSLIVKNPEFSIRFLSGVFTISTVLLMNYLLKAVGINSSIRILMILSLALNPFFIKWSISGMEASASMSATFFSLIFFLKSKDKISSALGFVMGISFLLRPEFAGIFIITLLFFLITKRNPRFITFFALQFFSVVALWFAYAWFHFGTVIPNTFKAKAGDNFFNIDPEKLIRNIKVLIAGNIPEFIILIFIAIIFLFTAKKNKINKPLKSILTFYNKEEYILIVLWILGFYLFYILKNVTILSRYSLMFVPIIILLTAVLLSNLKSVLNELQKNIVLSFYLIAIVILNNAVTLYTVVPSSNNFAKGFQKTFKEISQIIKTDKTVQEKTIALTDVGIVGFFSEAKVYDLAGLVDHHRFNYKNYYDYITATKPTYLVLREEADITEVIPQNISYKILYKKRVPGFGINNPEPRTVTLYRLFW